MGRWKKMIREAIWVLALALALAGGAYALRPSGLPLVAPAEEAAIIDGDGVTYAFIDLEAAVRHFQQGSAIFADARSVKAFDAGHITGALHLDPQDFDVWSSRVFSEIAVDEMIIAYCDGAQCSLSRELAEKFAWLGYENVAILKDGWNLWQSRRMPVSKKLEQK